MDKPTLIISGASRGLGAVTAKIAASIGANVVLTARSEADLVAVMQAITAAIYRGVVPYFRLRLLGTEVLYMRKSRVIGNSDGIIVDCRWIDKISQ